MPIFEWDPGKAASNLQKHGVAFEDAIKVFDDDQAVEAPDADPDEERFKIIGMVVGRLLTVIYTERSARRFRIISAWKATKHETETYNQS
jgi:uncharacterized DUF497 family protein